MARNPLKKTKKCTACRKYKLIKYYYKDKHMKDGIHHKCKKCQKEYRINNLDQYKKTYRQRNLKTKYRITLKDYDELLIKQNSRCAICNGTEANNRKGVKALSVDHNHVTGKIRGLLCNYCNRGLGLLKDSKEILLRAVEYLDKFENSKE